MVSEPVSKKFATGKSLGTSHEALAWKPVFTIYRVVFRSARTSWNTFVRSSVRSSVGAKNLDQLYSYIYASQTHITIHIPKGHDKYYPLTPRDHNDKYTCKDKYKDNDKGEMTKRLKDPTCAIFLKMI